MTKKKGAKGGGSGEPPTSPGQNGNDELSMFQRALEQTQMSADIVPVPSMLRDFFAEFDTTPNEFLALSDTEHKKQGRAERYTQKKIEDYLTFSLGKELYGVAISKVREIIKPQQLTFVPRQPGYVRGILSLRGSIVPVFSLSSRLGLENADVARSTRIVVFEDNDELLGFYVDEVREVVRVPVHAVEPPPQWKGSQHQDAIRGVGRVEGKMIILLEFDTLVSHLRAA